ncbi:anhydro-N-acetylmuramic acid kinase [Mangrovitalea sediminis]|uniref:anhydro-N-acetylmuramic acid kinase n=1 Tax=Mangrovitalea sediminis TaxID=1982043 RepID=UPI000BE4FF72|nr:anhydro-N-acetylmuramic acid kinase [Mangrovitalea sediminis]
MTEPHAHYVGLMSGTSMDAVDGVLVSFFPDRVHLTCTHSMPYPAELREGLLRLVNNQGTPEDLGTADQWVGEVFAQCTNELIAASGIDRKHIAAIGSHGQTLRHHPGGPHPFSLQIGDPNVIAERTGLTTVADFRRRDMAAGGQGAPLVPAFHQWLFQTTAETRAIVNIGGIANITVLPQAPQDTVLGFDTGPGNGLMDAWCQQHWQQPFDEDGRHARAGTLLPQLLHALLSDPYFNAPPPKSTGKEYFNLQWLNQRAPGLHQANPEDIQRTLLELTVASIAKAITDDESIGGVYICGGGARNTMLMKQLTHQLANYRLCSTQDIGLAPEWVEAAAFAWLAMRSLQQAAGNLPTVTGARGPRILGAIYAGASTLSIR